MGRTRKYATEEEAHEAKKQQMRENYQKRKAAKAEVKEAKWEEEEKVETKPKPKRTPKKKNIEPPKLTNEIINQVAAILTESLKE